MYQQQMPQPYGQVSYPPFQHQPASYPPQPGPAYGYGYPPFDASSFRREYSTRLSELTMNSRPIIHNLSMMAQNFTRYADIVADCLQAHIRRVSGPSFGLPSKHPSGLQSSSPIAVTMLYK